MIFRCACHFFFLYNLPIYYATYIYFIYKYSYAVYFSFRKYFSYKIFSYYIV